MQDHLVSATEDLYCHNDATAGISGASYVLGGASTQPYKVHGNVLTLYFDIFCPTGVNASSVNFAAEATYSGYTFVDSVHCLPLIIWGGTAVKGPIDSRLPSGLLRTLRFDNMYLIASADLTGLTPPTFNATGTYTAQVFRNAGIANNAGGGKVWQGAAVNNPASLPSVQELSGYNPDPSFRYLSPQAAGTKSNMLSLVLSLTGGASVSVAGYVRAEMQFTVFG